MSDYDDSDIIDLELDWDINSAPLASACPNMNFIIYVIGSVEFYVDPLASFQLTHFAHPDSVQSVQSKYALERLLVVVKREKGPTRALEIQCVFNDASTVQQNFLWKFKRSVEEDSTSSYPTLSGLCHV